MKNTEVLYCLKIAFGLLTTKYGITECLLLTISSMALIFVLKGYHYAFRALIRVSVFNLALTCGLILYAMSYITNSKKFFYIGFIIMVVPPLISESICLAKKKIKMCNENRN